MRSEISGERVLKQHEDLFKLIRLVRSELYLKKQALAQKSGDDVPWSNETTLAKKMNGLDIAGKVLCMSPCSTDAVGWHDTAILELGTNRNPWQSDSTFVQYFSTCFPPPERLNHTLERDLSDLKADSLLHVGVTFVPTDDISSHLNFNQKTMTLQIFHHAAFLKENLRLSKGDSGAGPTADNISREEAARRQVYLEILDSSQKLLFSVKSPKSFAHLERLVNKHNFDASILSFESSSIRTACERELSYHFLASRLIDLYEELQNPTPRGRFEEWLERRSGARYAMMATMIGVAFAVFLGFLSLGVSVFQAWIGWQAWKHPTNNTVGP